MPRSPSNTPVPKVVAAGLGAAAATVAVVIVGAVTGSDIPVGLEGAIATLFAFAFGYLKSPTGMDQ